MSLIRSQKKRTPQPPPLPPPGAPIAAPSVPLLPPVASPICGGAGIRSLRTSSLLVFFQVWLSSDICKVAATMTLWNKVSPASPYLDDVRSDADEKPVRVGSARSSRCSCCVNQEMQLAVFCCGDFDLFFRFVLRQDLVSSTLYFGGEGLQACVAWGVPLADVR
ncbi:hypothetical protein C2845_PM01G18420 [Panicum miliaceum]|uniref:Uncharacterized protein n=1 Tax=Panicum miliaceum TaxID=4540 RepID=A0A3L6TH84_PANMI|nr:hypothetical protein C2845_PM01G18420 [Panicum miliaceum]